MRTEEITDETVEAHVPDCIVADGVCYRPSCAELFRPEAVEAK